MEKPKISACLIIFNEGDLIRRCLESLKGVAYEIVLVHDGECNDNTLEIAAEFGAKIFVKPHIGDSEYYRPFSYSQASGDWILQIDGDEFLSSTAKRGILELVKDPLVDAYALWWPVFYNSSYLKRGRYSKLFKPCLFRKEKMYMVGVIHEYPRTVGKLARSSLQLEHQPLHSNLEETTTKKAWPLLQAQQTLKFEAMPTFNIVRPEENPVLKELSFRRNRPTLALLRDLIKTVLLDLRDGILWSGLVSVKIAVVEIKGIFLFYQNLLRLKSQTREGH